MNSFIGATGLNSYEDLLNSSSNNLIEYTNTNTSNTSNFIINTSNNLIQYNNINNSNQSNYVITTSNNLIGYTNTNTSNTSNFIINTSNNLVGLIKNTSNNLKDAIDIASNLLNQDIKDVETIANQAAGDATTALSELGAIGVTGSVLNNVSLLQSAVGAAAAGGAAATGLFSSIDNLTNTKTDRNLFDHGNIGVKTVWEINTFIPSMWALYDTDIFEDLHIPASTNYYCSLKEPYKSLPTTVSTNNTNSSNYVLSTSNIISGRITNLTTTNIAEGTNLYFTNTRVDSRLNTSNIYGLSGNIGIGTTNPVSDLTINSIVVDRNSYNHSEAPLTITNQTATSTTTLNDPKTILHLCRQGTSAQAYGAKASFKLCRYENNSLNSRTRLDLTLANASYDDANIISFRSDGKVGIGKTNPTQLLDVNGTITGTTINATTNLQENGTNLISKYTLLSSFDSSNTNSSNYVLSTSNILFNQFLTLDTNTSNIISSRITNLTTTNLAEGSNLYYTTTRANTDFDTRLGTKTTTNIAEGSNLYYTAARVNTDFDTRLATKTTTNLTEGSNLYYTTARANIDFDTRLGTKTTTNIAEGSNLYYTTARVNTDFDTRLATKTTTNLTEGSNLYYTTARANIDFDTRLGTKTTTNIAEGSNLYYTTTRDNTNFDTRLATKTTTNIAEGSNLYYTTARANTDFDTRLGTKTTTNIAEGSNLYYTTARANTDFDTRLATKTTTNLAEGSNLYFTNTRVNALLNTSNIYGLSGNVGIGRTNPSQLLDVNGNIKLNNIFYDLGLSTTQYFTYVSNDTYQITIPGSRSATYYDNYELKITILAVGSNGSGVVLAYYEGYCNNYATANKNFTYTKIQKNSSSSAKVSSVCDCTTNTAPTIIINVDLVNPTTVNQNAIVKVEVYSKLTTWSNGTLSNLGTLSIVDNDLDVNGSISYPNIISSNINAIKNLQENGTNLIDKYALISSIYSSNTNSSNYVLNTSNIISNRITSLSTTNIAEGTNQYFTNSRVDTRLNNLNIYPSNSKIGIGNNNPQYTLDVNGTIFTSNLIVGNNPYDFNVFAVGDSSNNFIGIDKNIYDNRIISITTGINGQTTASSIALQKVYNESTVLLSARNNIYSTSIELKTQDNSINMIGNVKFNALDVVKRKAKQFTTSYFSVCPPNIPVYRYQLNIGDLTNKVSAGDYEYRYFKITVWKIGYIDFQNVNQQNLYSMDNKLISRTFFLNSYSVYNSGIISGDPFLINQGNSYNKSLLYDKVNDGDVSIFRIIDFNNIMYYTSSLQEDLCYYIIEDLFA